MRYLGLDLGTRTVGVALTDELGLIASPYKTIRYTNINGAIDEILKIIKEKNVSEIALGLPKNMDGTLGFAAKRSTDFKDLLSKKTSVPITLVDERLTTMEAERYLLDEDMSRKKRKKVIDAVAASIILNTFLNMKGNK